MNRQIERRPKQIPLDLPIRTADLSFFYMFSAGIQRGIVKELGVSAFSVWVVLRAYARLSDGRVYLSLSDIHEVTGLAITTIRTAISKLETRKLIQVVTEGKQRRRYFVIDLVPFKNVENEAQTEALEALREGQSDGEFAVRYVPKTATRDRQEIAHFLEGGSAPGSPNIQLIGQMIQHVEHLHVHLTGDQAPSFLREALERVQETAKRRAEEAASRTVIQVEKPVKKA